MFISTRNKILLARLVYASLKVLGFKSKRIINRGGINFDVDLNEGIDLHLFLFGNFQQHVYKSSVLNKRVIKTIIDVGGNNGAISLFFASQFVGSTIHAFEPTSYAINKFKRNIELNPSLGERIKLNQAFVGEKDTKVPDSVYSSWPVSGKSDKHEIHLGVLHSTNEAGRISIDEYVEVNSLEAIDLIKIDTDGYEHEVLQGAIKTLQDHKPIVIFEAGLYIFKERETSFDQFLELFDNAGYRIATTKGEEVNGSNFKKYIPNRTTVDLIAIPL